MCVHAFTRRERERESQFKKESEKKKVKPARGEKREERRERFLKNQREKRGKDSRVISARRVSNETKRALVLKEKNEKTSECIIIANSYPRGDVCVHPVVCAIIFCFDDDVFFSVTRSVKCVQQQKL